MEYFAKIIDMNLLKNHINRDPIIDWFEIQNIRTTHFTKDKNNYFRKYILNETIYYKNKFLNNLKEKLLQIHPNNIVYINPGVNETIHLIKNKYPVIFKPNLISEKYSIHVSVDIIIIKRLFLDVFKDIKNSIMTL